MVQRLTKVGNAELTDEMIKENYHFFKDAPEFQPVHAVICSFTSSMCEGFIALNKTIIFNPAHRYNIGRCSERAWKNLNENYYRLGRKNKLVVSSMSRYDAEYQAHFTGIKGYRLYAYGGFYAKNIKYNPIRSEILVGPTNGISNPDLFNQIKNQSKEFEFKTMRELYSRYSLSQLAEHRAIVIFPYAVMSYSIIDFYISNLPIFVPSISLMSKPKKCIFDRSIRFHAYCGNVKDLPVDQSEHTFSPNSDADADYEYWVQYADYYQWPFVTVFDSVEDLFNKLKTLDLKQISENMRKFNKYRETDLLDNWCKILKKLPEANIPSSFQEALNYFEVNSFVG
jgi:hypothetical protein